jgi:hypothetical protein
MLLISSLVKLNSVAWVRERTIPTQRPPLVSEVIANLIEGATWSAQRIPYGSNLGFLDQNCYYFFQVAPQVYPRG